MNKGQLHQQIRDLSDLICLKHGLNLTELAKEIDQSPSRLSEARSFSVATISPRKLITLLEELKHHFKVDLDYDENGVAKLVALSPQKQRYVPEKDGKLHFLYFFCNENEDVAKAYFVVTPSTSTAHLKFYHKRSSKLIKEYQGTFEVLAPCISVSLELSQNPSQQPVKSQIIFSGEEGLSGFEDRDVFQGIYLHMASSSLDPIAGTIMMFRITGEQECLDYIMGNKVMNYADVPFYYKRIKLKNDIELQNNSTLPLCLLGLNSKLVGSYSGYYLRGKDGEIRDILLNIYENGTTIIKPLGQRTYSGIILPTDNDNVYKLNFDHEKEKGLYKIIFFLRVIYNEETGTVKKLEGNYTSSGTDNTPLPFSGRVYFNKLDDYMAIDKYKPSKITGVELYELITKQKQTKLPETGKHYLEIARSFLGLNDNYGDSLAELVKHGLYKLLLEDSKPKVNGFIGCYYGYCLSNNRNIIHRYPILIQDDGSFILKGTDSNQYKGKATRFSSFLSLHAESKLTRPQTQVIPLGDEKEFHFHILFFVGELNRSLTEHFFGVFSKPNLNMNIECGREILVVANEEWDNMEYTAIEIPRPNALKIDGQYYAQYKFMNENRGGLGSFLTGVENNLIVSKTKPGSKFERNEDYGRLYFNSAAYLFSKGNEQEARKHFDKALEHGFNDVELCKRELGEHCPFAALMLSNN